MKYRYFIINQIFNYDIYYKDFFVIISNYINPEINNNLYSSGMQYASNYKILFEALMKELTGVEVKATPTGQMYEIDKYDLYFVNASGIIGNSSWTHGINGITWTISLNNKSKSIPIKNWDEIITFINDNI